MLLFLDDPAFEERVHGHDPQARVVAPRTGLHDASFPVSEVERVREVRRLAADSLVDKGAVVLEVLVEHPEAHVATIVEVRTTKSGDLFSGDVAEFLQHEPLVHDLALPFSRVEIPPVGGVRLHAGEQ